MTRFWNPSGTPLATVDAVTLEAIAEEATLDGEPRQDLEAPLARTRPPSPHSLTGAEATHSLAAAWAPEDGSAGRTEVLADEVGGDGPFTDR